MAWLLYFSLQSLCFSVQSLCIGSRKHTYISISMQLNLSEVLLRTGSWWRFLINQTPRWMAGLNLLCLNCKLRTSMKMTKLKVKGIFAICCNSASDANKDQSWMWGQKKWTFGGKIWNEALFLRDNGKSLLKEGTDDQKGRTKKRNVMRGKRWFLGAMGRWHRQHCAKCSWAKSQSGLEILLEVQCYFRPPSSE